MASPPTPYPNTTLSTTNPTTGQRQLRRTPVGLRRMYDAEASVTTESTFTSVSQRRRTYWPWLLCCLLLLLLLMLAVATPIAGYATCWFKGCEKSATTVAPGGSTTQHMLTTTAVNTGTTTTGPTTETSHTQTHTHPGTTTTTSTSTKSTTTLTTTPSTTTLSTSTSSTKTTTTSSTTTTSTSTSTTTSSTSSTITTTHPTTTPTTSTTSTSTTTTQSSSTSTVTTTTPSTTHSTTIKTTSTTTVTTSTQSTSPTTPALRCPPDTLYLDIALLLDTSDAGMSFDQFQLLINFLTTDFFNEFHIGTDATRVAIVKYDKFPVTTTSYTSLHTKADVISLIKFLRQHDTHISNLGRALTAVGKIPDDRPDAHDVVLVFLAENSSDDARTPAQELQFNHTIVTVALGSSPIDTHGIASSAADAIVAPDFNNLKSVHNAIINRLCNAV